MINRLTLMLCDAIMIAYKYNKGGENMKKIMHLHMPFDQWKRMAEFVVKSGYVSRTAFILDAIREKIERMENL